MICHVYGQGRRNEFKSGTVKRRGLGLYPQWGCKGQSPLVGVRLRSSLKLALFSKMRLEFVQQVDGTIITKFLIKSLCFLPFFKLKSGTANAVAVPTALFTGYLHINLDLKSTEIENFVMMMMILY